MVHHLGEGADEMRDMRRTILRQAVSAIQGSIGRLGLRIYDAGRILFQGGGGIQIDDGGSITINGGGSFVINDDGTFVMNGNLTGDGLFDWSGNAIFRHTVNVVGPMDLGATLTVTSAGEIIVGNMVINPDGGGSISFPGGAVVQADPGGGVRIIQGTNRVYVGGSLVSMQAGSRAISISASGIQMTGLDTIPSGLAGGAVPGTIWSDGSELFRVV